MTLPLDQLERVRAYFGVDMDVGELHALGGGAVAVFTRRSPGKESGNEDGAVLVACGPARAVLAVADGFGGQPAGEQACELALTALAESVARGVAGNGELRDGILNGFDHANKAVSGLGLGAATTLAVVEIDDGHVRPYHVGDSAVMVVGQRGRLRLQTVSHSPIGYAVEAGFLEEAEALHHEERHLVSNMVGSADMRIEIGPTVKLRPLDTVLLASDGLFDNLRGDEVVEVIRKGALSRVVTRLARLGYKRMCNPREGAPSKPDDLTFVLYRRRPLREA